MLIKYHVTFTCNAIYTFWQGLISTWSLRKKLLTFWDCLSSEPDALLRVQNGTLPDKRFDTSCTAIYLIKGYLADDLGAVVS
jgi:hypothetical protein